MFSPRRRPTWPARLALPVVFLASRRSRGAVRRGMAATPPPCLAPPLPLSPRHRTPGSFLPLFPPLATSLLSSVTVLEPPRELTVVHPSEPSRPTTSKLHPTLSRGTTVAVFLELKLQSGP